MSRILYIYDFNFEGLNQQVRVSSNYDNDSNWDFEVFNGLKNNDNGTIPYIEKGYISVNDNIEEDFEKEKLKHHHNTSIRLSNQLGIQTSIIFSDNNLYMIRSKNNSNLTSKIYIKDGIDMKSVEFWQELQEVILKSPHTPNILKKNLESLFYL